MRRLDWTGRGHVEERGRTPASVRYANLVRLSLEAQISLLTDPQEFSRLCNAVLGADHGDDFLPIDDDQGDRGNDGYLKTEKRIFAAHCFKRIQNQGIEGAIRAKMVGDLGKAIALDQETDWPVEAWTFISNYPVSDAIGERVQRMGTEAGLDVSWRGADYLALGLQRHPEIRARFPALQVNEVGERLSRIEQVVTGSSAKPGAPDPQAVVERAPRTLEEERAVIERKPPGWEYLLFAGALLRERRAREEKWHDRELRIGRGLTRGLDDDEARGVLRRAFGPMRVAVNRLDRVLEREAQERAFGKPGEPGDAARIKHLASRLIGGYEELLDLQAELRSCSPPEEWEEVFSLAAEFPDEPLAQIHVFVDQFVEHADKIPAYFALPADERVSLVIELTLNVAPAEGLPKRFSRALKKLERRVYR
jgi:hypothetical protein